MSIAIGGFDVEHAFAKLQHRDVERAAAEVVHRDLLVLRLFQTVGQRGGGGFVDDAEHFQPCNPACILGGLALRIIEIGRGCDDRLGDLLAQPRLGVGFELA